MTIRLYNSMTREKEDFVPINPEQITIYNCGPTVYDRFHIGNARNFIFVDMMRRYLEEFHGHKVRFMQNITDIDDKIIARVKEEKVDYEDFIEEQTQFYFEDLEHLRIKEPTDSPHVFCSDTRDRIAKIIHKLIGENVAYSSRGNVFFRTKESEEYGQLSNCKVEEMKVGARVPENEDKDVSTDFAIWKKSQDPDPDPSWRFSWGAGRPGWHIECVAMAQKMGETIDIHCGGIDLVFPHHENEIAIAKAFTGKPLANYWIHNEFVRINEKKMSKSFGNVLPAKDAIYKYGAATLRYFLLSSQYRKSLDFCEERLEEAAKAVRRIHDGMDIARKILKDNYKALTLDELKAQPKLKKIIDEFITIVDNDFNFPGAFNVLHSLVSSMHEEIHKKEPDYTLLNELYSLTYVLAYHFFRLEPDFRMKRFSKNSILDFFIQVRKEAKKQKDFVVADMIKKKLKKLNIIIEDYPSGSIWRENNGKESKNREKAKLG